MLLILMNLSDLTQQIHKCTECSAYLPLGPRPVVRLGHGQAKVLLIGQAPGTGVHKTGIPWDDPSGDRLRTWLGISKDEFYDETKIAIMPMGFCYPGKGASGDLPPRAECAPLWHGKILKHLPQIKLTLLIGKYAQSYYLGDRKKETLTDTIRAWKEYIPSGFVPLVHPSPRNAIWMKKNPWFEKDVIPYVRKIVADQLNR